MLLSAFPVSPALKTTVLSECYLIIHKLLWCYNFAKSSECYVLKLLPSVLLLIPVLVLLTASLTILICLQINPSLVSDGCCMNALHMLLHMFQANLHLQIHEYLPSLKLLEPDWLLLVWLLLLALSSTTSPIFSQSNVVELRPMNFWNHIHHNRSFFQFCLLVELHQGCWILKSVYVKVFFSKIFDFW